MKLDMDYVNIGLDRENYYSYISNRDDGETTLFIQHGPEVVTVTGLSEGLEEIDTEQMRVEFYTFRRKKPWETVEVTGEFAEVATVEDFVETVKKILTVMR